MGFFDPIFIVSFSIISRDVFAMEPDASETINSSSSNTVGSNTVSSNNQNVPVRRQSPPLWPHRDILSGSLAGVYTSTEMAYDELT
jgi:hypothetical protein